MLRKVQVLKVLWKVELRVVLWWEPLMEELFGELVFGGIAYTVVGGRFALAIELLEVALLGICLAIQVRIRILSILVVQSCSTCIYVYNPFLFISFLRLCTLFIM